MRIRETYGLKIVHIYSVDLDMLTHKHHLMVKLLLNISCMESDNELCTQNKKMSFVHRLFLCLTWFNLVNMIWRWNFSFWNEWILIVHNLLDVIEIIADYNWENGGGTLFFSYLAFFLSSSVAASHCNETFLVLMCLIICKLSESLLSNSHVHITVLVAPKAQRLKKVVPDLKVKWKKGGKTFSIGGKPFLEGFFESGPSRMGRVLMDGKGLLVETTGWEDLELGKFWVCLHENK